ncbi:hypothetical protein XENORESO_021866 [Xenotaenia resolanae]|uniref:Uncharacterized protein n=1 Tax=Xenotaenia resolanae TaxID=208358 RepID=A0ABV0W6L6_9TELE
MRTFNTIKHNVSAGNHSNYIVSLNDDGHCCSPRTISTRRHGPPPALFPSKIRQHRAVKLKQSVKSLPQCAATQTPPIRCPQCPKTTAFIFLHEHFGNTVLSVGNEVMQIRRLRVFAHTV